MRVDDCEVIVVGNPPPHRGGRYFILVKLVSADGIVGWGEAYGAAFAPSILEAAIKDSFARHLAGRDPRDVEQLWRRCHGSGFQQRGDPTMSACASALEMACWDMAGKAIDTPVHRMLGGRVHERLRSYTYLYPPEGTGSVFPGEEDDPNAPNVYDDPELAASAALAEVERGFTAIKLDPAGPYSITDGRQPRLIDLDLSVRMLAAIRGKVGTRADILYGTHGQFTPSGAVRMASAIAPFQPLWFEEPLPPDAPSAAWASVAAASTVPIASGERLVGLSEFAQLIEAGVGIVQPNLGRCGGLMQGKKIAAYAEARHALVAPHCYCGPIVGAANAQLAATCPNFLVLEAIGSWDGFHAELLTSPLSFEDGHTLVTDAPGLGVEVNEAVARAHPYESDRLHLEMADTTPG